MTGLNIAFRQRPDALAAARARITGLRDLPARTALRIANTPRIRRMLAAGHGRALAEHSLALPVLTGIDLDVLTGLRRHGVFVTTIDDLGLAGSAEIVRAATAIADDFAQEAHRRVRLGMDFNVAPAEALMSAPEIFAWGLNDRIMSIAEAYLELPVGYDGPSINYTVADGREVSTRKWHRDWEDRRMLKVAIYLNDVDDVGGPFEMIGRQDAVQTDALGFQYGLATDAELETLLGPDFRDDITSCQGPAGTVVFTDTAGFFHRGKPATVHDRKALFFSYFSRTPRHPFLCERSGLSRREIGRLSAGLTASQRAAVEWRRTIPFLLRLIPPARI